MEEIETDDSVTYCSGCSSTITDSSFVGCRQCKCFLHKQCAGRPKEITHPVHKSHPLTLQLVEHPNSERCSGCDLPLRVTSYYGCITCSVYFHKFCLELPPKIEHEAYKSVFAKAPHYLVLNYNGAGEVLESRTAFSYVCDTCDLATSIPELFSKTIGHILTLVPPYPTEVTKRFHDFFHFNYPSFKPGVICFICGEAVRSLGFFFCDVCYLHVHVGCALPPTFISDHHRHLLKLISDSADDHFCSTSTDYDDFYCNHCEKLLHPGLAVYKCPETDCGGFVAHCYCEFVQAEQNDLPEELNIEKYLSDPISNEALITSDPDKWFYYEGKVQSVRREQNISRTTSGGFTDKHGDQGRWEESKGNRTIRRIRSADFIDKSGDQGRREESEGNRTIRRTRSADFTDKSGDQMKPNDLPEELIIEKYLSDPISNEALITSDQNKCFYYEGKVQSVKREQNIQRTTSGGFTDKRGDQGRWEESEGKRTIRRIRSADFIDKSGDQGRWEESEGNRTIRRTRSADFTDKSGDKREPNDHPEALFTEKNLSDPIGRCSKSEGNRTARRIRHLKKTCVSQDKATGTEVMVQKTYRSHSGTYFWFVPIRVQK